METEIALGTRSVIDGESRGYYYGYWIKIYEVHDDTLQAKKRLIEALTHRLFNHVEHGLNVPGRRLDEARRAYDSETDPARRRVKGAMLAGAMFNRATDIFTKLVEMQALGIEIAPDNALMRECGRHLQEALSLGRLVLHRSGEEGIDELWGEPFKAFTVPLEDFYESRYVKIALTMRDIDRIVDTLIAIFDPLPMFRGIDVPARAFGADARIKCETLRTDREIFDVWSRFVVAAEQLMAFAPPPSPAWTLQQLQGYDDALVLIRQGRDLVTYIARARTPMPKSMREWMDRCEKFSEAYSPILASAAFSC
ncbi:MAG: hypothetical protein IPH26_00850 [Sterolibacteriaceae bacterium]|jgi:hypothetical protein|uniref:Uncharacterized protein n=1 Tax=Candidatus Methylophosphatis roskildensis TaxID=2899263 RepID=A0A9D7HSA6_9PROT|nr:hypothetical protein [Candidatus Methylophosphatis roskildensis]MBK7234370.1 hypothetical protein [Sterolibacteriaceae bacterium]